ncbi:MAG: DNA repair protein radA, partial [Pelotomaculum thermopropionicum]
MRVKSKFCCRECGHQSARWMGRCPGCGAWNSFNEETVSKPPSPGISVAGDEPPRPVTEVPVIDEERLSTRFGEVDRILGGGLVPGTLVLVGGDPGIGKSTLLLQVAHNLSLKMPVVYV